MLPGFSDLPRDEQVALAAWTILIADESPRDIGTFPPGHYNRALSEISQVAFGKLNGRRHRRDNVVSVELTGFARQRLAPGARRPLRAVGA